MPSPSSSSTASTTTTVLPESDEADATTDTTSTTTSTGSVQAAQQPSRVGSSVTTNSSPNKKRSRDDDDDQASKSRQPTPPHKKKKKRCSSSSSNKNHHTAGPVCSICWTSPIPRRHIATLVASNNKNSNDESPLCRHQFCFECIDAWSQRENTCPLCKRRFDEIVRSHPVRVAAQGVNRQAVATKDQAPASPPRAMILRWPRDEFVGEEQPFLASHHHEEEEDDNDAELEDAYEGINVLDTHNNNGNAGETNDAARTSSPSDFLVSVFRSLYWQMAGRRADPNGEALPQEPLFARWAPHRFASSSASRTPLTNTPQPPPQEPERSTSA